jgi:monoamine oxidase
MDVAVVGAGLSGLSAAQLLAGAGMEVGVVDSRARVGGRMMTVTPSTSDGGWIDVGATWHWADQPRVQALARDLGITAFPQYAEGRWVHDDPGAPAPRAVDVPPADPACLRFAGGCQPLCERLAERLPPGAVSLGATVRSAAMEGSGLVLTTVALDGTEATLRPEFVVMAVPPRLVLQDVSFTPALPGALAQVMEGTETWMADAVKCVAVYESPFWRAGGWSGSAFSHAGPLHEVHDATTPDGAVAALWGLVSPDERFRDIDPRDRAELVLEQLVRLFGPQAGETVEYLERDWSADPNTNQVETDVGLEPLDYGHPLLAEPLWDGRLLWAGTETAAEGGGHMEGALVAGQRAAAAVLERASRL